MYKKVFNSLFTTKVDAIGLSIFRMFYSVVLFLNGMIILYKSSININEKNCHFTIQLYSLERIL